MPLGIGVQFFLVYTPHELHETGTIQKLWNRTTKYVKTRRVHKLVLEILVGVQAKNCDINAMFTCTAMVNLG